jgi:hypothetical protein
MAIAEERERSLATQRQLQAQLDADQRTKTQTYEGELSTLRSQLRAVSGRPRRTVHLPWESGEPLSAPQSRALGASSCIRR